MFKITVLALLPAVLGVACNKGEGALCPERGTGTLDTGSLFEEINNAWMVESPEEVLLFISEEGACVLESDGGHVRLELCEAAAGAYSVVEPSSFDGCPAASNATLSLNTGFHFGRATSGTVTIDSVDETCVRGSFDTKTDLIPELSGSFQATVCEPCGPAGSQSCDGDVLETCTEEGFILRETCEFGCMAGRCNECTPSTTECRQKIPNHWDELITCDASGAIEHKENCPLGCNEGPDPDACFVLEPSNLPADTCDTPGETDLTVTADMVIDTDASCPGGVVEQGAGLPEICVFKYASYEVQSGVTVRATGSRALAIVATEAMSIDGTIDVSANGPVSGPGAQPENLGGGGAGGSVADGGGGAGHGREGADGGAHGGIAGSAAGAGGVTTGNEALVPLVGGSRGGNAGAAAGGGGGGALQLVSCGTLTVSGVLHAGGGGGQGGPGTEGQSSPNGGAGGGSGGAILIEVPIVESSYYMLASGGGGGAGGLASGAEGTPGEDGDDATPEPGGYAPALGGEGILDQGSGGDGGLTYLQPATTGGAPGSAAGGAGGGGGGVGRIRLNAEDISIGGGSPPATGGNVARH